MTRTEQIAELESFVAALESHIHVSEAEDCFIRAWRTWLREAALRSTPSQRGCVMVPRDLLRDVLAYECPFRDSPVHCIDEEDEVRNRIVDALDAALDLAMRAAGQQNPAQEVAGQAPEGQVELVPGTSAKSQAPPAAGPADVREAAAKVCDDLAFAESCHDCYDDLQRAAPYRRAAKAIRAMKLPDVREWITVTERLPDLDIYVMWYDRTGNIFIEALDKDDDGWDANVTHWMKLPEPPQ